MRKTRARKNVVIYKAGLLDEAISKNVADVDIHESVEQIAPGAFFNCYRLVHVRLPLGLREIGDRAFKSCTSLEEVSIPSSVETLGEFAFFQCSRLNLAVLVEGLRTIGKCSFQECDLGLLSIPASVTTIGESAFEGCRNLRVVMLREGLQRIGNYAFKKCINLLEVDIPSTFTSLGTEAFSMCFHLKRVGLANAGLLTNTGKRTFANCYSIESMSLPETLISIDGGAFDYCKRIHQIALPEGLTIICNEAFNQCALLHEVSIPSTVMSIGMFAFSYCSSLKEVNFGEGLRTIEAFAFSECLSLSRLSFPSSMEKVGASAFVSCKRLVGVEFQNGQNIELEPRVFSRCEKLINISIPSSMESVWASAFDECSSLERGAGGSEYILQRLTDRFASHPVHEACYHSSLPTLSVLVTSTAEYSLVDDFGMTPFHIAVTAPNLHGYILECLLNAYTFPVLFQRDENGKTMMDYLLTQTTSAKSGNLIDRVLHKGITEATSGWGLPTWRSEVSEVVRQYSGRSEELFPRTTLDIVGQIFASCVKLESTSLLELALWNKRIQSFERSKNKRQKVDRDAHRCMCGANIVIPTVLEFLGDLPTLTTSNNW